MLTIKEVKGEGEDLDHFRQLIREHKAYVGEGFNPKGLEEELANPFSRYAPPNGVIAVGYWNDDVCGIGALQDHGGGTCELKRIFVRPEFRRRGIARAISEYLIDRARQLGYNTIWLDTLRRLDAAVNLYQLLGFVEVRSAIEGPGRHLVVMERSLKSHAETQ